VSLHREHPSFSFSESTVTIVRRGFVGPSQAIVSYFPLHAYATAQPKGKCTNSQTFSQSYCLVTPERVAYTCSMLMDVHGIIPSLNWDGVVNLTGFHSRKGFLYGADF
jgi:hypothetical protein